jgi:hypothetical protein
MRSFVLLSELARARSFNGVQRRVDRLQVILFGGFMSGFASRGDGKWVPSDTPDNSICLVNFLKKRCRVFAQAS